jgi:hypothetical protein
MLTCFFWLRMKTIGGSCKNTNITSYSAKAWEYIDKSVIFSCRIREFVLVYTSIILRSEIPHLYLSHNRIYLVHLGLLFDF